MSVSEDELRIYRECRDILKDPWYSATRAKTLIGWLQSPNAALSDIAGRCLFAIGSPAINDLYLYVTTAGHTPWPMAIWVLGAMDSDMVRPHLRTWLKQEDLEQQCATTLASILVADKKANRAVDPADVEACELVLDRAAPNSAAARLHLRTLRNGLAQ